MMFVYTMHVHNMYYIRPKLRVGVTPRALILQIRLKFALFWGTPCPVAAPASLQVSCDPFCPGGHQI